MADELMLKFGKLPPREDDRTIKLENILRLPQLPVIPEEYDNDLVLKVTDDRMFLNNIYGNCVIADRAHHTIRFEKFEQGQVPEISDEDVKTEYFKETGGPDSGLVMLNSLNKWRQEGWTAGGKEYTIDAFASVDWKNHEQVKQAICLLNGVDIGFQVPQSAIDQFKAGKVWDVVAKDGGIQGGHAVYAPAYLTIVGYNQIGPVIETWAKRVQWTWNFGDKYVDECWAIVDNKDDWLGDNSPIDKAKLEGYLTEITGSPVNPPPVPVPPLPPGCLFKFWPFRRKNRRS